MPVIDLRFVCCEQSHYANEIEPSVAGGARIAAAIAKATVIADAGPTSAQIRGAA